MLLKYLMGDYKMLFNDKGIKQLRNELKLSQKDLSELLGVSRGYIGQLERGIKPVTEELDAKLQQIEKEVRKKLLKLNSKNKMYFEECKERYELQEERKRELQKNLELERKQQFFNPSMEASVDMIWLSTTLDNHKRTIFEKEWLEDLIGTNKKLCDVDLRVTIKDLKYPTLQNGRFRGEIVNNDGKIYFEYLFLNAETGTEPIPRLKVQFNPNKVKWDNPYLLKLMFFLGNNPLTRKFDVCIDYINTSLNCAILGDIAKRDITIYRSNKGYLTYQFGNMNSNGTRIYDKRGEKIEKDKKDIGYDCTRIETRVTMNKSLPIELAETFHSNILYPSMLLMDLEYTKWSLGIDVDPMLWSAIQSIMRGDTILNDYKVRKRDYEKLKGILEKLKTVRICLTQEDVTLAFTRFKLEYLNAYYSMYGEFNSVDVNDAKVCIDNF